MNRPSRRTLSLTVRCRGLVAAVVCGVIGMAVAGCGSAALARDGSSHQLASFGSFAGYTLHGTVNQVGATIVVPRIAAGSVRGFAGTWIGAEGEIDQKSLSAPFFQIGVNEFRGKLRDGRTVSFYVAFWSSTAAHFRPHPLFLLAPGDAVALSMRRTARGDWSMSAADSTAGTRRTVVAAAHGELFDRAEWLQEDVADSRTGDLAAYPAISTTRFSRIQVNSSTPAGHSLRSSWMSTPSAVFGPTAVRGDSFTIVRVHPSAEALRFQRVAVALGFPGVLFAHDVATWQPTTSQRLIKQEAAAYALALKATVVQLQRDEWSRSVRPAIVALIAAATQMRDFLLHLRTGSPTAIRREELIHARRVHRLAAVVRALLHIPETAMGGPLLANYVHQHDHQ